MSRADIRVEVDPARLRTVDAPEIRGSFKKFHAAANWKPVIPFEKILSDLLDFWREKECR